VSSPQRHFSQGDAARNPHTEPAVPETGCKARLKDSHTTKGRARPPKPVAFRVSTWHKCLRGGAAVPLEKKRSGASSRFHGN